jgi:hypothetical protein
MVLLKLLKTATESQSVTIVEIIVKIIAIEPTLLDLAFFCNIYLIPGQSPNGGRKTLKRYTPISLIVVSGGSINFLPQ